MTIAIKPKYIIKSQSLCLCQFWSKQEFVTRPNCQNKKWTVEQQQDFLNNLIRHFYTPPIVLREIYTTSKNSPIFEIIDGQQRINAIQNTLRSKIPFHYSLKNVLSFIGNTTDKTNMLMCFLQPESDNFVFQHTTVNVDIIEGIGNPKNQTHQKLAQNIFQQLHTSIKTH
jgi:hypothetical protein